jgi:dipeptidase
VNRETLKKIVAACFLLPLVAVVTSTVAGAQVPGEQHYPWEDGFQGCTSIMVARLASTDGSVMTAHSCDGNYRQWVNIVPHQTHPAGARKRIYWGLLHTETPDDMRRVTLKGEIPEVEETYQFMNVGYPCMNEHQLMIGETTIGGRRELRNDEGLFNIENLQEIVLQRCRTAREAIQMIGRLVKEYGYGDSGECLTFADPKEVWHFEIMGAGLAEIGAVWAAVRIPDDQVGVSANIPRISTLDLTKPDFYMASENVRSLAEEMGWWDSKSGKPFRFWEAYSGRKPYSMREFFILSTMAPGLKLNQEMEELPFSVKPEKKVSVQDMFRYYRETYEGTEFDATKNLVVPRMMRGRGGVPTGDAPPQLEKSPMVNNWGIGSWAPLLNALKPGTVEAVRTIAIAGCSYSQVNQARGWLPDAVGGVAWFSLDNPGQSPRIPIFAGATELPPAFAICGQKSYREDSATWWYRRANRLAQVRWGVTREYIEKGVMDFETQALMELPLIEQKALELYKKAGNNHDDPEYRALLTRYTNDFAHATMAKWWELGDLFFTMFARGF